MIFNELAKVKIVPVITIHDAEKAEQTAKALTDGGLPCAEVTFRTPVAADAIAAMTQAFPQMLVGAGTILTPQQADTAKKAGARFSVAPGFNAEVVRHCQAIGLPHIPGVMTPSDIEAALALGLTHVKFFPAAQAGGAAMLRALAAPYGALRFMPTGGITAVNIGEYLALGSVFACGGSWVATDEMIKNSSFEQVTRLAQEAVEIVGG
jgi:2-dehydro-3-deoxyphosphogluconate aldolase/(4S)-4-hydroxy-2-oxoglutarate aldolase